MKKATNPWEATAKAQQKRWQRELKKNPPVEVSVTVEKHKTRHVECFVTVTPYKTAKKVKPLLVYVKKEKPKKIDPVFVYVRTEKPKKVQSQVVYFNAAKRNV